MVIISGGDSFVWGSELGDCTDCGPNGFSQKTFPALLSEAYDYQCAAFPGNGNDSIARKTMIACEKYKGQEQFVIVMWTFHSRYEFRFEKDRKLWWEVINSWTIGNEYTNQEDLNKNKFVDAFKKRAEQSGIATFAKSYFTAVGFNGYWQIYTALREVVFLQNYLKANNIPYLFTCADNIILNNFYTTVEHDETIDCLFNQIDFDKWYLFPEAEEEYDTQLPRGFYQWAVENKYSIGPEGHPLEDAHKDAADLIRSRFDELVKKHN